MRSSADDDAFEPQKMPGDAVSYAANYSLTNFINCYYEIRDCLAYQPRSVLLVGVGVGLEPILLREKFACQVTTLDVDPGFQPDVVGSVHHMPDFATQQFDVALASHVLEHLPFSQFSVALAELARVARQAVIYLPYGGRHLVAKLTWAQRYREWSVPLHVPPRRRVDGESMELQGQAHYWECGYPGFSLARITAMIEQYFRVDRRYHNQDWHYSMNFCLTSRLALAS